MEKAKAITTAQQVFADLTASNGSSQVLAMIKAGVPRVTTLGDDILVCARLSSRKEENVRPRVMALLQEFYPGFDAQNVLIEDEATWMKH